MELNMFKEESIIKFEQEFEKVGKNYGYNAMLNYNDKYLGNSGYIDINDNYVIKLRIFSYPKCITIKLIEKYQSFIMDGKELNNYVINDIRSDEEGMKFINESIGDIFAKIKEEL